MNDIQPAEGGAPVGGEVPAVQTAVTITRQHLKTWSTAQIKQYGNIPLNQQYLLDIWAHMDVARFLGI